MASNIRRLGIVVALTIVLLIGVAQLAFSYSWVGVAHGVGSDGIPLAAVDISIVPQIVIKDANMLATELFGDSKEMTDDFVSQLLTLYAEARDKDFVVIFNSGGWGRTLVENSPGWRSIFSGIEAELDESGYRSLVVSYQRRVDTLRGYLNGMGEMLTGYSSKAEELASRVEFLTKHIPDLNVIIAGESTGTVISDNVIHILEENPQVYSIQTGPPFWHNSLVLDKSLVITGNGIDRDSFTDGDTVTLILGILTDFFGLSSPQSDFGTTSHYVREPGHDYWWNYPEVRSQVTKFLDGHFKVKW